MESVLSVYQRRYHPDFPVVCVDEAMKQLVKETVTPIAAKPGQVQRQDYQYERNGTAILFMVCEPITGYRSVEVTERRTAVDYAYLLRHIVDELFSDALLITIV
jgi:hypothetical protein